MDHRKRSLGSEASFLLCHFIDKYIGHWCRMTHRIISWFTGVVLSLSLALAILVFGLLYAPFTPLPDALNPLVDRQLRHGDELVAPEALFDSQPHVAVVGDAQTPSACMAKFHDRLHALSLSFCLA